MGVTSSLSTGTQVGGGAGGGRADILIIMTLLAKGLSDVNKMKKALTDVEGATKKTGTSAKEATKSSQGFGEALETLGVTALATFAALKTAQVAFQQLIQLGKQGAAFRQMGDSFVTLTASVGGTVELLDDLRAASMGTISDMDLMSAAAIALAGASGEFGTALYENIDQIMKVAKAAEKANPALGNTSFMFQSLTVGLKRLSPRLIDNTGLQIRLSEAYKKLADERGKASDELTSEEQQLALLNATLDAGQRLIDQVGGNVESATDAYNRLGAAAKNAKDAMAESVEPAIQPTVSTLADMVNKYYEIQNAVNAVNDAIEKTVPYSQRETITAGLKTGIIEAADALAHLDVITNTAGKTWEEYAVGVLESQHALKLISSNQLEFRKEMILTGRAYTILIDRWNLMSQAQFAETKVTEEATGADKALIATIQRLYNEKYGLLESTEEVTKALQAEEKEIKNTSQLLGDITDAELRAATGARIYGNEITIASLAEYEYQRNTLLARLATEELTEEQYKAIEVELALAEATIDHIETLQELQVEYHQSVEVAREASEAYTSLFDSLDRDIDSPISDFIEDLRWLQLSQGEVEAAFESIKGALGFMPADVLENLSGELLTATLDLKLEADLITTEDAVKQIQEVFPDLGYKAVVEIFAETSSVDEALAKIKAVQTEINIALTGIPDVTMEQVLATLAGEGTLSPEVMMQVEAHWADPLVQQLMSGEIEFDEYQLLIRGTLEVGESLTENELEQNIPQDISIPVKVTEDTTAVSPGIMRLIETDKEIPKGIAVSASDEMSTRLQMLIEEESMNRPIEVLVEDEMSTQLQKLILDENMTRTIDVIVREKRVGVRSSGGGGGDDNIPVDELQLGGYVNANRPYLVGEGGPELFVPTTAGEIVPNNALGGGNITVNVNVGSVANDIDMDLLARDIALEISRRQQSRMR